MRYLAYLAMTLLISCSGKMDETGADFFSDVKFFWDTVYVDSGDDIIFLRHQLLNSDVSKDSKYLYNFNDRELTIERINLDKLRLEDKITFDREGPNGIGGSPGLVQANNEGLFTLDGMFQTSLFSWGGEKLASVYFENFSLGGSPMNGGEQVLPKRVFDVDDQRLYGLIQRYKTNTVVLGIMNLENYEISKLELESFEKLPDYHFQYSLGNALMNRMPLTSIDHVGTKLLLSNEITSTLMWYDTEVDSLFSKAYTSQLAPSQKEKEYKKEFASKEEYDAEFARFSKEINFMPPFWDPENKLFYRFSYQIVGGKAKVYLTALDEDLNQIGETKIPQLTKRPFRYFFKDGKVWFYENMDDELAFVRLSIEK
ncbi:DUF4221 family protein [Algoriphagus sp.]|uniref:DUF4221 family protein n=1 Tax=Algoriphagus sp. TaxID=1872435 RepID=UPI003F702750